MTERTALIRAVLADPFEETARLVFADWLDETGDPTDAARAACIRHRPGAAPAVDVALGDRWHALVVPIYAPLKVCPSRNEYYFDLGAYDYSWRQAAGSVYNLGGCLGGVLDVNGFGAALRTTAAALRNCRGWVRALFATHPIVRVTLDAQPVELRSSAGPPRLMWDFTDRSIAFLGDHVGPEFPAHHPSRAAAARGLGRAAVNYGRRLADLDPLQFLND